MLHQYLEETDHFGIVELAKADNQTGSRVLWILYKINFVAVHGIL